MKDTSKLRPFQQILKQNKTKQRGGGGEGGGIDSG